MEIVKISGIELIVSPLAPEGKIYIVGPQDAEKMKEWLYQKEKELEEMIF
jgi:threonine dehydratase